MARTPLYQVPYRGQRELMGPARKRTAARRWLVKNTPLDAEDVRELPEVILKELCQHCRKQQLMG